MRFPYADGEKITWVIGDIHGMCDPLLALLRELDNELVDKFIFVGDYIDHGPSSKQVLDVIIGLGDKAVTLMGNHEYLMLQTLFDEDFRRRWGYRGWKENGAEATMHSFGYKTFEEFGAEIAPQYVDFLNNLSFFHTETVTSPFDDTALNFLITHAGLIPKVSLEEQLVVNSYPDFLDFLETHKIWIEDTFIWVRHDFLTADPDLWSDYIVIHGHTPTHLLTHAAVELPSDYDGQSYYCRRDPESGRAISIDIDTGAAFGNKLTAIGLSRGWIDTQDGPGLSVFVAELDIKTGYYNQRPITFDTFGIEAWE